MDSLTRPGRWAAALALAVAASVAPTPDHVVAAAPAAAASADAAGEAAGGKIVLVMDASGSMKEPAAGGTSKIAAAKRALRKVVDGLPDDQQVGLRVYGATVFSKDDPGACTDSQLVVPIGSDNRRRLRESIDAYRPYGETPIGYALGEAGKDLGETGRRSIVLVSDGESTCRPDPCKVAQRLRADGIGVRIDVVGLDVNAAARRQLSCIAESGGGVYYDARDGDELTESLRRVSERAARDYETIGEPVDGGTSVQDAPTIGEGDWVDHIDPDRPQRFYRIERSMEDSTLIISAAYRSPSGSSMNTVSLQTPDGDTCGSAGQIEPFAADVLVSAGAAAGAFDTSGTLVGSDDPCLSADELIAIVEYSGPDTNAPVEIRVTELPTIEDLASLPKPSGKPPWKPPPTGTERVSGGTSFADAEHLAPGGYAGTIVPGETLTFTVDVDWGEQLNVSAVIDTVSDATAPVGEGNPSANLAIYGPSRLSAGTGDVAGELLFDTSALTVLSSAKLAQTTGPVAYRRLGDMVAAGASRAGPYTITLALEDTPQNASLPVPYSLGVDVVGKKTSGPTFTEADTTNPDTANAGGSAGNDSTPAASGDDGASGAASGDDAVGISGISWLVGSLGLIALLGAAYLALRRREPEDEI